jgi:lipopolysaccharide/colanic/teichoic acid biosynthesis glycosyltransferase
VTTLELSRALQARRRWTPLHVWTRSADPEGGRRALNIAVAAAGLVVSAPVMLLVAVLVKLTSRGPVFYTQTRVGLDRRGGRDADANGRRTTDLGGKPFTIYKFRTMSVNGHGDAETWARPDDPRVTALGRFLRQYRCRSC